MVDQLWYDLAVGVAASLLITALAYVVLGVDDLILDGAYWAGVIRRSIVFRNAKRLDLPTLRAMPQKRIAIFIPCWHEEDVVEQMLEFAIRAIEYKRYTIFVGVYPNDEGTLTKVQRAAAKSDKIVAAVNPTPGPTTKADNLNSMYATMLATEAGDPYEIVVLHDVEDVIHPYESYVYNYLMPNKAMVQIPVFPLEREWHKWTAWTYADEFAENHLKDLVVRERVGSFVPSAGVGCAFSRAALDVIGEGGSGSLFSTESLTEDYQAGLRLKLGGYKTVFVHQRFGSKPGAASYVATREYFPDTLKTAVRQKARWIVGICIQAWRDHGWSGNPAMRYSLYRDRKALLTNLLTLYGYVVSALALIVTLGHALVPRLVGVPIPRTPAVIFIFSVVMVLTVERIISKVYFVTQMYGWIIGLLSIPRLPWAGLVNALATGRALYLVVHAAFAKKAVVWHKTAHAFPTQTSLAQFETQVHRGGDDPPLTVVADEVEEVPTAAR
ncbi:MAG: phage adsorption protein NrfB [Candidatus Eremiobacteraeota bacterium]|nr:phage adsorption protein NrfB [Candidatus Eremiobacteraeota bacterium]